MRIITFVLYLEYNLADSSKYNNFKLEQGREIGERESDIFLNGRKRRKKSVGASEKNNNRETK